MKQRSAKGIPESTLLMKEGVDMVFNGRRFMVLIVVLVFAALMLSACSSGNQEAASSGAQAGASGNGAEAPTEKSEWDIVLEAAKKEGKVVIAGPPGETRRAALVTAFEKAYPDIEVEMQGATARDYVSRILAERQGGQFNWDLLINGPETPNFTLKPDGALDPIAPYLMLPEVTDDTKWTGGFEAGFMDKEKQFIYAFNGPLVPTGWVNRDVIPESELNSWEQLADPKWKGKISWDDPTRPGWGSGNGGHLNMVLGNDYVRALLSNEIVISNDARQQADWLIRGTYPVAIIDPLQVKSMQAQGLGANVKPLAIDSEAGIRLSPGFGSVMVINKTPHPNATKVYLNWLLSPEGQKAWVENTNENSRRTDVGGPAETQPDPNKAYKVVNTEENNHFISGLIEIAKEVLQK